MKKTYKEPILKLLTIFDDVIRTSGGFNGDEFDLDGFDSSSDA